MRPAREHVPLSHYLVSWIAEMYTAPRYVAGCPDRPGLDEYPCNLLVKDVHLTQQLTIPIATVLRERACDQLR
ncbi:unnamed protein product [Lasius platythorax]|uniref:Uncharacterized protein n=1 Tax=Lasius platythorax TaxID=488582 RepID=A0AAV2N1B4_9HYME